MQLTYPDNPGNPSRSLGMTGRRSNQLLVPKEYQWNRGATTPCCKKYELKFETLIYKAWVLYRIKSVL